MDEEKQQSRTSGSGDVGGKTRIISSYSYRTGQSLYNEAAYTPGRELKVMLARVLLAAGGGMQVSLLGIQN